MIKGERWEALAKSSYDTSLNQAEARVMGQRRLTQDMEGRTQKTWGPLRCGDLGEGRVEEDCRPVAWITG